MVRQVIPELDACTTPQTLGSAAFLPCGGSSSSASRRTRAHAGRTCLPQGMPWRQRNVAHGSTRLILTRRRCSCSASGTTGFPKGVMQTHSMLRTVWTKPIAWRCGRPMSSSCISPYSTVLGCMKAR